MKENNSHIDIFSLRLKPPTLPAIIAREKASSPVHILPSNIPQTREAVDVKPANDIAVDIDRNMKILIVGNVKCGKTSIIRRYTTNAFDSVYRTTVGADFTRKDVGVDFPTGRRVGIRLQLWYATYFFHFSYS